MKWTKEANESIAIAGGQDYGNHRVMRWPQGTKQGTVIVGGNGRGAGTNQFIGPFKLSFDRHGNLYVVDQDNHRVQRFSIE
ncbi:unnamed protein product [Rotaria magnacalcarata]|uniref:Uncharacterized protein n=1 Tax=Rotaria magnacalcarata TaxID=392030 RepID=A0A816MEJ4_9BILA|nr:unnamed protein product [Rotaria magnacalcarata]